MTRATWLTLVLTAFAAVGTGSFWLMRDGVRLTAPGVTRAMADAVEDPVIYYQDPDGKPSYAAEPKQTPDGRPYRAVHASEDVSFDEPSATAMARSAKRVLYYRNPMGLPDVSPTPKRDSMGMDYIPVYEGEDDDGGDVRISAGRQQRIGVTSEPAARRVIAQPVRAPGTIQLDERRISVIALRAEAFIDDVADVTTGSPVRKGQALMRVYSPTISDAAAQYVATLGFNDKADAPKGARQRVVNQDVPPEYLAEIERTKRVPFTFIWSAPRDGVILERNVSDGMRVNPGDVLFRLADVSSVWALVDVSERDLAAVSEGQPVTVRVRSFPNRTFSGKIALIYPVLDPATRTVRVRVELPNQDFLLRPEMYAEAEIDVGSGQSVIAVPDSAVIDSGDRQVVIIDRGDGRFEPRPVKLGTRGAGYVEIREGVAEGDSVVTSANFLIDAESNLKAALRGLATGTPQ
jgi:Cu(I)/Ag(I) efflux system membrane fusion protein